MRSVQPVQPPTPVRFHRHTRAGFASRRLAVMLALLLIVPAIGYLVFQKTALSSNEDEGPATVAAKRGEFVHEVTERGNVESASNVEVTSKVRSNNSSGAQILEIVEEGYFIAEEDIANKKVLVKLDSSSLDTDLTQQKIKFESSRANLAQAENVHETAKIASQEYLEGTYPESIAQAQIKIDEATLSVSQAQQLLDHSERLFRKGYVTETQLTEERITLVRAQNQRKLAVSQKDTLERYTHNKVTKQLDADINTAEAKLKAAEASHKLDSDRLELVNEQIANCTIYATEVGQVVYANLESRRGSGEVVIEPGTIIRERQVIFRLPDPTKMQVKARVNESRVALVEPGMRVAITLDAFPDMKLEGTVEEVGDYPASSGWMGSSAKEYETIVKIIDPPEELRPGLTAEVKIRVAEVADALQLPIQAIIEHGAKHYCIRRQNDAYVAHEVTIGATNDRFVMITEGLEEGDLVIHNAAAMREKIDLPELKPLAPSQRRPDQETLGRERLRDEAAPWQSGQQGMKETRRIDGTGPTTVAAIFQRFDTNADGRLQSNELAGLASGMRPIVRAADVDGDGAIDRAEMATAMARLKTPDQRQPGQGQPGRGRAGQRSGAASGGQR